MLVMMKNRNKIIEQKQPLFVLFAMLIEWDLLCEWKGNRYHTLWKIQDIQDINILWYIVKNYICWWVGEEGICNVNDREDWIPYQMEPLMPYWYSIKKYMIAIKKTTKQLFSVADVFLYWKKSTKQTPDYLKHIW